MSARCIFAILFMNLFVILKAGDPQRAAVVPYVNPTFRFTENAGQWESNILFRSRVSGGVVFIEKNALTFNFYDQKKLKQIHHAGVEKRAQSDYNIRSHGYRITFAGANQNPKTVKMQQGHDYENFYIGKDQSKWKSHVRNYSQVWLKDLYNGIDYEILGSASGFKYNFHVRPDADPSVIRLKYDGVDKMKLQNGRLILKLEVNEVIEHEPYAYQIIEGEVREVPCKYVLKDKVLSFEFPDGYDKDHQLVIDPVLVFAAQAGSTADNFGMTATFDNNGNLYSGGTVYNIGYPFVLGSYSNVFNGAPAYGNTDVFITKYNPTGNALIYSTYLGGNGSEVVTSLIVDKFNNLCLYGATGSTNFPVLAGAAYTTFAGGSNIGFISNGTVFFGGTDIFIAKFNTTGSSLLACTYYGGSGNDGVNYQSVTNPITFALAPAPGTATTNTSDYDSLQTNYGDTYRGEIQLDTLGNIYIISSTRSSDLPMNGGFDNTLGGIQDGVVAKFNPSLTSLMYSSFVGGSGMDCGNGIFVRPNFEVYVTGGTTSSNFPGTTGGQSSTNSGGTADGYLMRINAAGNAIMQSTYIGTTLYDNSFFVQCNNAGEPHVYGQSNGNMPIITPTNAPAIYSVTGTHQFIIKYNAGLTTKLWATKFGSNQNNFDISPSAFAVDECNGNIYLSGWGGNILNAPPGISGMPLQNPTQAVTTGYDFYMMALSANAQSLLYGSYFGGSTSQEHVDGGTSRFDRKGVIYQSVCAGCGANQDFPITQGAWPCPNQTVCPNPNPSGNCNNGVFKINFQLQAAQASINTNTIQGCTPLTVTFTNSIPGTGFIWHFGNGQTNTVNLNPTFTYTAPGVYTVSLVVYDTLKCVKKDSATTFITVKPLPNAAFNATLANCTNTVTFINTTSGTLAANPYIWNLGDGSPTLNLATPPPHTYTANGTYTITMSVLGANGCSASAVQTVSIFDFTPTVSSSNICYGTSAPVNATGGTSYSWSPPAGLSNTAIAAPVASPTANTIYTVQVNNNTPGYVCSKTLTTSVQVYPKPTASFVSTINPCGGGVTFFDGSMANISSWNWTLTSGVTSTVQNPYNFYSSGGTHSVILVVTNSDGCKDTTEQVINVPVPPPLSISANTLVCLGTKVQLSASGGVAYVWSPAATLDNSVIANPVASPTANTQYSVTITNSNNCTFILTTNVGVSSIPSSTPGAIANPVVIITGNTSTLVYTGAPGSNVVWLPPGSTTPPTGYTVTASPVKPTTYTAIAQQGACSEKATVVVEAYTDGCIDSDVFVPNTFTPNGDGQNDKLFVRGLKIDRVYFAVYNRWGELVFETNDKNTGWDGIYKGRPADVGVFGWYLKVKCLNGQESFKKGNVTLIR